MSTVVVYRSFLGSTRKYSKWLAEALNCDRLPYWNAYNTMLAGYDTVIVFSGTYAGHMPLVSYVEKQWDSLQDKRLLLVAVGGMPVEHKESRRAYERIPVHIKHKALYFKLPSRMAIGSKKKFSRDRLWPIIKALKGAPRKQT